MRRLSSCSKSGDIGSEATEGVDGLDEQIMFTKPKRLSRGNGQDNEGALAGTTARWQPFPLSNSQPLWLCAAEGCDAMLA